MRVALLTNALTADTLPVYASRGDSGWQLRC